jgi:hypothetical protein
MKQSKFLSWQWRDLLKGAVTSALTAAVTSIYTSINSGALPQGNDWKLIGISAAGAFLAYMLKNGLTNSDGQFAKTEGNKSDKAT